MTPGSLLKKGSDPLRASAFQVNNNALQRVRPLFQQAAKWSRWRFLFALVAIAIVVGLPFWLSEEKRLNVILVTLDTTRADHLGCYGYQPAKTPTIDAIAARGVLLEHAYTVVPLTLPAHASMLTGSYPFEHGLLTNGSHGLPEQIPTLAESLAERGYATGAFLASFVLNRKFGLDRGFEVYDDDVDGPTTLELPGEHKRSADQIIDHALAWLKTQTHKPFFCWVHLFDPHAEYLEHQDTFGDTFQGRPYDAEIAYSDLQLKRLIDYLETRHLTERTLVVIVGDHGEGLNEHRERWHGYMLYNSTLRVPMIVSLPSKDRIPRRVSDPVSVIDLTPTILDCLELPPLTRISGRSLRPLFQGKTLPLRTCYAVANEAFLEEHWSPLRCLISSEWKYIETTKPELYNLSDDPGELSNLAESHSDKLLEMQQQLHDLEASGERFQSRSLPLPIRERKMLKALGYVGAGHQQTIPGEDLPDLKDKLDEFNSFQDLLNLVIHGESESIIAPLYQLISTTPRYLAPRLLLAQLLFERGKFDEAESQYLAILDIDPDNLETHGNLGRLCASQKLYEPALKHLNKALKSAPLSAELHFSIAKVLKAMGPRRRSNVPFSFGRGTVESATDAK